MTVFYKEKEREHFFKECINQKLQFFKASLEAPEEISRKGERQVLMQGTGWLVFGRGDLTNHCSVCV